MVIENLHAHVLLKFLDRDFACEAVIGAIEAYHLGDQALDERRSLGEDGLQNCLLPLEGHNIARITISVGIARDVGDGLARVAIGGDALELAPIFPTFRSWLGGAFDVDDDSRLAVR